MPRSVPAGAALLALLVVISGCSALTESAPPSDDRAVEVRNNAAESLDHVSTYRFEMDGHASASQDDESISFSFDGNGSVNRTRQVMSAVTRSEDETRETYVFDDKSSMQCSEPWSGWDVSNVSSDEDWFTLTPLGRQQAILERSNVYWAGNDTVNGNRTVVIEAYPSVETVDSIDSQTGADVTSGQGVENISIRVWVDPKTWRPVQSRMQVVAERGGATATVTLTTEFHAYNAPVDVTVPPEAKTDDYKLGCPSS